MQFSMNGYRRNMRASLEALKQEIIYLQEDGIEIDDLIHEINEVLCQHNSLNYVYDNDNEMFDVLEDNDIELIGECEE